MSEFHPHHINATPDDLKGNHGIGRYIFLPGSSGRARSIASRFVNVSVKKSERGHDLYLGQLEARGKLIDVASVATGMGCPSVDIIVNELYRLGGKRFLRVGTAGSLQPDLLRVGDIVVGTGAVRDENTSQMYVPLEFPALASVEFVACANLAATKLWSGKTQSNDRGELRCPPSSPQILHFPECRVGFGLIHSKDSLFAREFKAGPLASQHRNYARLLHNVGVLASEMEASHLFILSNLLDWESAKGRSNRTQKVLSGAILALIGDDQPFAPQQKASQAIERAVRLAIETVKIMALFEQQQFITWTATRYKGE